MWRMVRNLFATLTKVEKEMQSISLGHLYDINAAANRNYWFDKRGNRWPLRDSL